MNSSCEYCGEPQGHAASCVMDTDASRRQVKAAENILRAITPAPQPRPRRVSKVRLIVPTVPQAWDPAA